MQALIEKLSGNGSLTFAVAAIAVLIAAILLLFVVRLALGRKLRLPAAGKGRLPRLGVVDAFNLDGQRQLVIVRRDNVEHLIMIGGPNDLVIETEIIRAEAREGRLRDKELREPHEPAQAPAGVAWPPEVDAALRAAPPSAAPQRKPQPPSRGVAEAEPGAFAGFDAPVAPAIVPPTPRSPVFPLPPRRSPPPFTPPQRTLPQREPSLGRLDEAAQRDRGDAGGNLPSGFPRAPLATPFLRSPPPRPGQEPGVKPNPQGVAETPASGPPPATTPEPIAAAPAANGAAIAAQEPSAPIEQAAPSTAPAPEPAEAPVDAPSQDHLDSIEEEMAKLLGRGPAS